MWRNLKIDLNKWQTWRTFVSFVRKSEKIKVCPPLRIWLICSLNFMQIWRKLINLWSCCCKITNKFWNKPRSKSHIRFTPSSESTCLGGGKNRTIIKIILIIKVVGYPLHDSSSNSGKAWKLMYREKKSICKKKFLRPHRKGKNTQRSTSVHSPIWGKCLSPRTHTHDPESVHSASPAHTLSAARAAHFLPPYPSNPRRWGEKKVLNFLLPLNAH